MVLGTRMPGYSLAKSRVKTLFLGGKYLFFNKSRLVAGLFGAENEYTFLVPVQLTPEERGRKTDQE